LVAGLEKDATAAKSAADAARLRSLAAVLKVAGAKGR
jgi:hypothetical protein